MGAIDQQMRERARQTRNAERAVAGTFVARKSGHEVVIEYGARRARVRASNAQIARVVVASAERWNARRPDLDVAGLIDVVLVESEIGTESIDDAIAFWRTARPDWPEVKLFEHVVDEARAALFAQRKRRFGSCFTRMS